MLEPLWLTLLFGAIEGKRSETAHQRYLERIETHVASMCRRKALPINAPEGADLGIPSFGVDPAVFVAVTIVKLIGHVANHSVSRFKI
jgi:hypothetical protein